MVDAPRHESRSTLEHKVLGSYGTVLAVGQLPFDKVGEEDAFLHVPSLLESAGCLGDALLLYHFGKDTPTGKPSQHLLIGSRFIGQLGRFLVFLGIFLHRLFLVFLIQFMGFAKEETFVAMVAISSAGIPIHRQLFLCRMMLPLIVALGTEHPLRVCLLVVSIVDVDPNFLQFIVIYFNHSCCFLS